LCLAPTARRKARVTSHKTGPAKSLIVVDFPRRPRTFGKKKKRLSSGLEINFCGLDLQWPQQKEMLGPNTKVLGPNLLSDVHFIVVDLDVEKIAKMAERVGPQLHHFTGWILNYGLSAPANFEPCFLVVLPFNSYCLLNSVQYQRLLVVSPYKAYH